MGTVSDKCIGGKCAPGCHLPYAYDRQSPVKYEKP